ncbi:PopZ family protein [Bosea sp. (in: a-proteobacteria)]|jgi:cell pole-organizing protein PopZ|uniref:PopZ family protein n=1 Tax=Bosea sp. (in: a-proteobacteria) TaxID=1871050 RepID=UPI003F71A902
MSAQPKPNEPSMEEILASIRRIIADDEVKPAEASAPAPVVQPEPEPAPAAEPEAVDDDVLDLGAEANLVAPEPEAPQPAEPEQAGLDVEFLETPEPEPVTPAPEPELLQSFAPPPFAPAPPPQQLPLDMTALISDQAGSAVTSAFGALAHTVLSNNARTLEDLVKDMLKPMLKTWLDDNLPTMVERLVRAEIERVARGGRN